MQEIKNHERHFILNNYKSFDDVQLCYWYNKINQRLNYLLPLFIEINKKKLDLNVICKSLDQEVFEIKYLRDLLTEFKI